jgi:hypothetical protein
LIVGNDRKMGWSLHLRSVKCMSHMFANGYYLIRGSHIELHFNAKPEDKIIETLHICNWHWYGKGK